MDSCLSHGGAGITVHKIKNAIAHNWGDGVLITYRGSTQVQQTENHLLSRVTYNGVSRATLLVDRLTTYPTLGSHS